MANLEHIEILLSTPDNWNAWRAEHPETRPDLRGAHLTKANLTKANLTKANLTKANLTDAYLSGADLDGANLIGANLSDADLRGANLIGAKLIGAKLTDADLTRANLDGANLDGANLDGANLDGAHLYCANLSGADLRGANLTDAYLYGATGNSREVKTVQTDIWTVTYTSEVMQIGCQQHPIADWWTFSDETIARMEPRALEWWKTWKPIVQQIIAANPATPTGHENKE